MPFGDRLEWEDAPEPPELEALVHMLQRRWPTPVTFSSETVGVDGLQESRRNFLRLVQSMCDAGLLQYEALLVGPARGPEVVDAVLTARGRALFGARPAG